MQRSVLFLLLLAAVVPAYCETREQRAANPHEVKIGWGDYISDGLIMLFPYEHEFDPSRPS